MTRIYIVDNTSKSVRYNRQWAEHVPNQLAEWGYEVVVVTTSVPKNVEDPWTLSAIQSGRLLEKLCGLLRDKEKLEGSIMIVPEARDYFMIPFMDIIRQQEIDMKVLGYWHDGSYYTYGDFRKKIENHSWFIHDGYERVLTKAYDYNLLIDDFQEKYFQVRFQRTQHKGEVVTCDLPFSYMMDFWKDDFQKEDIIVFNTNPNYESDHKFFDIVKKELPQYQFVRCHSQDLNQEEYHRLLSRAKVLFNTNKTETSPFSVFESMCFGVIPIIPDLELNKIMFSDLLLYDKTYLDPPYLDFIRNRHILFNAFKYYIQDYEKYRDELLKPALDYVHENYYNSQELKDLLCSIEK